MSSLMDLVRIAPQVIHFRPLHLSPDQFFDFCQTNPDYSFELTADRDLVIMPPVGLEGGDANADLVLQLGRWARRDGTGRFYGPDVGFVLPNGAIRAPDASWIVKSRLARLGKEARKRFAAICPDFVAEVRSASDRLPQLKDKMLEYRENGVRLGWLIDPIERKIYVYRPGARMKELSSPASVSADPVLTGFVLDLGEIWEPDF